MITGNCALCGIAIDIRSDRLKPLNFCSRGCGTRYFAQHQTEAMKGRAGKHRTGKEIPCTKCGVLFYLAVNRLTRSTQNKFCSKSCMASYYAASRVGEKGTNWQGGISIYPKSFRDARKTALERDGNTCQSPPPHSGRLEIHHKDGDKHNSDVANLITLCSKCHKRIHQWCTMEPPIPVVRESVVRVIVSKAVEKPCERCGSLFISFPSQKRRFCSYPCKVEAQTGQRQNRKPKVKV